MSLTQIRVGGFGGQGVILMGTILGKASAIYDNQFATMTRSYGPEARGGACSTQILVSDEPASYPYVTQPDLLIALSQEICDKFAPSLNSNGTILYEGDLVTPKNAPDGVTLKRVPCTRIAEELGSRVVLNIVMLGFFSQVSPSITKKAIQEAIRYTVPRKTIDVNLHAFAQGYDYSG